MSPDTSSSRQVYFLHIPKTAGTSLGSVIERQFEPHQIAPFALMHHLAEVVKRDPREISAYPLIRGHFGHTLISYLAEPPRVITMLREPVARTISRFKHQRENPMQGRGKIETIEEFLESSSNRRMLANFQVRSLALDFDLTATYVDRDGNEIVPSQQKLLAHTTSDLSDDQLLTRAKERLASFEFVGLTERFAESVRLMLHTFGWRTGGDLPSLNTSGHPDPTPETVAPSVRAMIEELTRLDADLYRFAADLLERRCAAMGDA